MFISGKNKGCGAILQKKYPLILRFHCQAHVANLVVKTASESSDLVKRSIAVVHELSKLSKDSIKVREVLKAECNDLVYPDSSLSVKALRPLCPTRWLCRFKPIEATVSNYMALVAGMTKIVEGKMLSTAIARARAEGILKNLQKPATYLGLCATLKPLSLLEQLSLTLQAEEMDLDSSDQAIKTVEEQISKYRDGDFATSFQQTIDLVSKNPSMRALTLPRQRLLDTEDIEKHYRVLYLQFLDKIIMELKDRFSSGTKSADLGIYRELCSVFKSGDFPPSLKSYPELDFIKLKIQTTRFREITNCTSLHEARAAYRAMSTMERSYYPQVLQLLRILLACPVSASSCERSFSALRRVLKLG